MKIAYFISDLRTGGAQKQMLNLIDQLRTKNENLLITWRSEQDDFYISPKEVERISIQTESKKKYSLKETLVGIYKTRKKIFSFKPDIVISFLFEVNALAILSTLGLNKTKIILSIREYPRALNFGFRGRLYNFLAKKADVFVVQNKQIYEWVKSKYPNKHVEVIPNYQLLKPRITSQSDDTYVNTIDFPFALAVGTKLHQKGFDLLVRSFKLAKNQGISDHLIILGLIDNEEKKKLIDLTETLEIRDYVHIFGPVGNIEEWYTRAKYYVMSSRHEGIPNSLIEALYLGVPSISFDCPTGPRELLAGGELGALVPKEDIQKLAATIVEVSNSPNIRESWIKKIRAHNFDNTNAITKLWLNLI